MKRCVFLLFDGARPDVLAELVAAGRMPNLARHFPDAKNRAVATTVFPSTTGPAYMPFLTGEFPGKCNIPGIRWLDRAEFAKDPRARPGRRSYVGYENVEFNRDLSPNVKTIYEKISPCFSINSIITRGLPGIPASRTLAQSLLMFYAKLSHHWAPVDRFAQRHLMKALDGDHRFLFASFLGIDEYGHLSHPRADSTLKAYEVLDGVVGELFAKLSERGILDETLVLMSSDHGLSATRHHFELWKWFEDRGRKVFYYPNIFRTDVDAACMVSGNAMANVYLKNGATWDAPTTYEDLEASGLMRDLVQESAIDLVFLRSREGGIKAVSRRGIARIRLDGERVRYAVETQDPFGYPALPNEMSTREALEKTFATDYPDAIVQAAQLFESPRTGDLVVTAALDHDLRDCWEIPEHHGSHGSLHKEHMLIPLWANRPVLDPAKPYRSVDAFAMIREHLAI